VAIGVVPTAVQAIVEEIEHLGGAAKLSGAGSLSGPGAGCLLVLLPEDAEMPTDLDEIIAPLGAEGVRVETLV